jgi:small-conductance mechanosensitive channel
MHTIESASILPLVIIVACYLIFAWQAWRQTKNRGSKGARAVWALIAVFILCSVAGYVPQVMAYFFDMSTGLMWWFHEITHWLLACAALALVGTNQAGAIAAMLDGPR